MPTQKPKQTAWRGETHIVDSVLLTSYQVKSPWLTSLHGDQHTLAPMKDKAPALVVLGTGEASTTRIPAGLEHWQGHKEEERQDSTIPPWDTEKVILSS